MEFIIFILFIIVVVIKNLNKAGKSSSSSENRTQQTPAYRQPAAAARQTSSPARSSAASAPNRYSSSSNAGGFGRSNYRSVGSANITRDGRVYASIDFDNTHYHAEGFDFDCCISFKGLPPGTDELAVLIESNNRHERELAKLMKERQS